jgi:hypothetical protein
MELISTLMENGWKKQNYDYETELVLQNGIVEI